MKPGTALGFVATTMPVPVVAQREVLRVYKTLPSDKGNFGHVDIYACETNIFGVIRKALSRPDTDPR